MTIVVAYFWVLVYRIADPRGAECDDRVSAPVVVNVEFCKRYSDEKCAQRFVDLIVSGFDVGERGERRVAFYCVAYDCRKGFLSWLAEDLAEQLGRDVLLVDRAAGRPDPLNMDRSAARVWLN